MLTVVCMESVHHAIREQVHMKVEQASLGEFLLSLDILPLKANSTYVSTKLRN